MDTLSSPLFVTLITLFIAIVIKQYYKLSTNRILILFFLPPIIFSILGESYQVIISEGEKSFDIMVFSVLLLIYVILFMPLTIISVLIVAIEKKYAPSLMQQFVIVSIISSSIMALFLGIVLHKPLSPALFASIGYIITIAILYYLTDVKNIVK